jgi:V8-like Glu-specific endopeptidase
MIDCTDDGGDFVEDIAPQAADSYYLIIPLSLTQEGSYGVDSNGAERPVPPAPADRCLEPQAIGGCFDSERNLMPFNARGRGPRLLRRDLVASAVRIASTGRLVESPRGDGPPPIPADLPGLARLFEADSGPLDTGSGGWAPIWEVVAGHEDATWVRVFFGLETRLRPGSEIRITALDDGAVQNLNASDLADWNHSTAYFNGSHVVVELLSRRPGRGDRVAIVGLWTGQAAASPESLCDTDDRVLSSDPRVGRVLSGGCSAWLINECFLTAGHCLNFVNTVVQFNVPLSTTSGDLVHPGPEDQYIIEAASKQSSSPNIVGDDWGYFGVRANTTTGLTPLEAQGDRYILASNVPPVTGQSLRITGYGIDSTPQEHNQVQQTATGAFELQNVWEVHYEVDTTFAGSGSPVEEEAAGRPFGIHTHGGCDPINSTYNLGTGVNNPNLQAALRNPIGVCGTQAACNNNGTCEAGEDCFNCVNDCAYRSPEAVCGDGNCDVFDNEDCVNCPGDCNSVTSGNPQNQFCCGDDVGCADARCTESGNTCTGLSGSGLGYCCGDGQCENAEDDLLCAVDCAACIPSAPVTNLRVVHSGPAQIQFSWDASSDPCLDTYVLLGSNDASSAAAFGIVAETSNTSFTADPPFSYFLVVLEGPAGDRGPLGHFGQ